MMESHLNAAVLSSGNGGNFENLARDQLSMCSRLPVDINLMVCNVPGARCIERADELFVPAIVLDHRVYRNRDVFEQAVVKTLIDYDIDVVLLAGWMRIFKYPYIFEQFGNRILNIHPSLLPKYPGTHSIEEAFNNNDLYTGVSVHIPIQEEVDAGPMIMQATVPILETDTLELLEQKIHTVEHGIYPLAIKLAYELYWN
jgi:phosphoribosylglycinamide formyltransferase 1